MGFLANHAIAFGAAMIKEYGEVVYEEMPKATHGDEKSDVNGMSMPQSIQDFCRLWTFA